MRTKSLSNRVLKLESLDRRILLAGDCMVALDVDGDLSVHCDSANNQVRIAKDFLTGSLTVEGQFGTALNGVVDDKIDFGVVDLDDIDVRMRDGNDTLLIDSVEADDIMIRLGKGDDTLVAGFLSANDDFVVRGGKGNDQIGLLGVTAGDRIRVRAGNGDDIVSANVVTATKVVLRGGNGTDTLDLGTITGELQTSEFEVETSQDPLPPLPTF